MQGSANEAPHYEPFDWHQWPDDSHGLANQTMRLTNPEETGADHCQHDNPTLGQELMLDWLTDVFSIDQTKLKFHAG